METKKAQMTRRMRDLAKTAVEMFKSDSTMSIDEGIEQFSEHCTNVAGEQFSKYDAKRIKSIGASLKHHHKITVGTLVISIVFAGLLTMTQFMLWSFDETKVKSNKQMRNDINTMKQLWTYQIHVDSALLWNQGISPYVQPMDTNEVKEQTMPLDWAVETMRAARR